MNLSSKNTMLLKAVLLALAALAQAGGTLANAVTPRDFGAKGDVVVLQDGTLNEASAAFRSGSATFSAADVGKAIVVRGAGTNGNDLVTKIQAFVSAKQVTLAANASGTVTRALTYYGSDDTAAIRACVYQGTAVGGECTINDGVTFMVSNTASTINPFGAGHNPISKGTINGHGRIIFAPQGTMTGGTNDRLFYISSHETNPMQIADAIAKGTSSFTAQDPSDAATLTAGDWVIITERDSAASAADNAYADWMQVASVDGAVVHTAKPFRMAFPNLRFWAGPPRFWGLGFRKVGPITSNITIRDITIIIPKMRDKHVAVGINIRDTRGTTVSNVRCQDASGNCFAGYLDQGLVFQDNHINGAIYSEFASEVDATISGNQVNQPDSDLALPGPANSAGLEIDFGTAFSTVTGNNIGPGKQVCLMLLPGVHDTVVRDNTCGLVTFGTGAACILCRGCYRMTITKNTCSGGTGRGTGISVRDASSLTAPIYSEGNRIFNNNVQGFPIAYVCDGRRKTDDCDHR